MSIEAAACAVAARLEGYPAFAEVILEQQLSPHAVAAMLRMSAAKDRMSLAVIGAWLLARRDTWPNLAHGTVRQSG